MTNIDKVLEQKQKLEQKKNRLAAEEARIKIKERKARTRYLIELGGLVVKAKLDHLDTNTLYGGLLSIKEVINSNPSTKAGWTSKGAAQFEHESKQITPVIVKFKEQPEKEIRNNIRSCGLKWNKFRQEWYGNVENLDILKKHLSKIGHQIEILD